MSGDNEEAESFYASAVPLRDPRLDGAAYVGLGAALHAQRRVTEALQARMNVCVTEALQVRLPCRTHAAACRASFPATLRVPHRCSPAAQVLSRGTGALPRPAAQPRVVGAARESRHRQD